MKNYLIILYFGFVFLLLSCEKTEKIDEYPAHKSQLVANCLFNEDEPIRVSFTRSLSPLDNAPFRVLNSPRAFVKIYEDKTLIDSFGVAANQTFFQSNQLLKSNVNYKFEAFYPGYPIIYSNDFIPDAIEVQDVVTKKLIKKNEYSDVLSLDLDLKFQNSHLSNDYMIIKMDRIDNKDTYDYFNYYEQVTDIIVSNGLFEYETIDNTIYIKTSGKKINNLNLRRESIVYNYGMTNIKDSLKIEVFNCSKNTYEYLRRLQIQNYNIDDPFSEPIPISNNIINGFGIFGGYNRRDIYIKF